MKIKRILMFLLLFLLIGFTGCKDEKKPNEINPGGNTDDPTDPDPVYNFMGQEFVIMVDLPQSVDPRSDSYQKLFKAEKIKLIEEVEKKYNLKVVYKPYPSEASWGGARERYIINKSVTGIKDVHIYEIPSYSIGTLAVSNAISPLTTYIEKYGNKGYWKEAKEYSTVLNEVYGYSDYYPLADEGIYYNIDLLEQYLGKENGNLPSKMWLEGNWTWDTFKDLVAKLDEALPQDYYVMGGSCYNWAYQMLGANGVHVVDTSLKSGLATQAGIDTVSYLNNIYKTYRWDANVSLNNATSEHMVTGKVAFHNGQSYWIFQDNKWGKKDFKIGFVPYPVGPNVKDLTNLSDYYINDVYGKGQYTISSSYSKANVKPGYEDSTLYDEIIFKIWTELQYFPPIDEVTHLASYQEQIDEYEIKRLSKYYGNTESVDAHLSVITKSYPDYFYSLGDVANGHTDKSYMVMLQASIKEGTEDDIRSTMISISQQIHTSFMDKYKLPSDYYD